MTIKWILPDRITSDSSVLSEFNRSLILRQELIARGIRSSNESHGFLDPDQFAESSPFAFPEMGKAIDRLHRAIQQKEKIGIWGDFDVDGQTSTAVLLDFLNRQNTDVVFHIPVRGIESHGINIDILEKFLNTGISLLITCDTGISENLAIDYAREKKVDVILTDHHEMPNNLPNAFAIINPHQLEHEHPLSYLAGVGVAYQLVRAYNQRFPLDFSITHLLDLVALGTIADIAVLKGENRYYTQRGLEIMNETLRPSLRALCKVSGTRYKLITENMVGFTIGPRLNSAGRLGDANQNVKFLLSEDTSE